VLLVLRLKYKSEAFEWTIILIAADTPKQVTVTWWRLFGCFFVVTDIFSGPFSAHFDLNVGHLDWALLQQYKLVRCSFCALTNWHMLAGEFVIFGLKFNLCDSVQPPFEIKKNLDAFMVFYLPHMEYEGSIGFVMRKMKKIYY
jgi:hypothetical protein